MPACSVKVTTPNPGVRPAGPCWRCGAYGHLAASCTVSKTYPFSETVVASTEVSTVDTAQLTPGIDSVAPEPVVLNNHVNSVASEPIIVLIVWPLNQLYPIILLIVWLLSQLCLIIVLTSPKKVVFSPLVRVLMAA